MLDKIPRERRALLDLVILVSALGLLVNLLSEWLLSAGPIVLAVAVGAALLLILWRLRETPLLWMRDKQSIPMTLYFDVERNRFLDDRQPETLHGRVAWAWEQLRHLPEASYNSRELGGKAFEALLGEIVEAAVLQSLAAAFDSGWIPLASRDAVKREDAYFRQSPEGLIPWTRLVSLLKPYNRALQPHAWLVWTGWRLPPRTRFVYECQPSGALAVRAFRLENSMLRIRVSSAVGGGAAGLRDERLQERLIGPPGHHISALFPFATFTAVITISTRVLWVPALGRRADSLAAWGKEVTKVIEDAARPFNVDRFFRYETGVAAMARNVMEAEGTARTSAGGTDSDGRRDFSPSESSEKTD